MVILVYLLFLLHTIIFLLKIHNKIDKFSPSIYENRSRQPNTSKPLPYHLNMGETFVQKHRMAYQVESGYFKTHIISRYNQLTKTLEENQSHHIDGE